MAWDTIRGYDNSDFASVEKRARLMIGKSLHKLDLAVNSRSTFNENDRGWPGKAIHRWFTDDDNLSEPDLPDVPHPKLSHIGLEIKTVPLSKGKRGDWLVKFPMSLAMIDYVKIHGSDEIEPIEDSVIFTKDRWTLVVYYSHGGSHKPSEKIIGLGIWDIEHLYFPTIFKDYNRINEMVKSGGAHSLSETQSYVLSARRKGGAGQKKSGGAGLQDAKTRAWALKAQYVRKRLEMDKINTPKPPKLLEHDGMDESKSQRRLESLSRSRARGHRNLIDSSHYEITKFIQKNLVGKTVADAAHELGYGNLGGKDPHARVARLMLHRRRGGLGEQGKSRTQYIDGKLVKVFTVDEDYLPTEYGLKMPRVKLTELAQEAWEDCSLIQNLHHVLLMPVRKSETLVEGEFLPPMLWRPNRRELEIISKEWRIFRDEIRSGKAKRYIGSNGKNTNDLTDKKDTDFLHMRPSARDSSVTELDPLGNVCTRLTLWLNDTAVQGLFLKREERIDRMREIRYSKQFR